MKLSRQRRDQDLNQSMKTEKHPHEVVFFLMVVYLTVVSSMLVYPQSIDDQVRSQIAKVEKGQAEEVRKSLPNLTSRYPNNPGVIFLQGKVAENGTEAVKFYQSIVDNFPKSEWADEALYASYQYYYAVGLYRTADQKMQQLKRDYPNSPFIADKSPIATTNLREDSVKFPSKEIETIPDSTRVQPPPANESRQLYTLQVGAFSTVKNAENQKNILEEAGIQVEITNKVRAGHSLYLVWAGSFKTAVEAKEFRKQIKKNFKIDSIVIERY